MKVKFNLLVLLLVFVACKSPYEHLRSVEDHYVIIYTGTESRKPSDPIDKNVFLVEVANVYKEYIERGVPAENIYVLYSNSEPDWGEELLQHIPSSFKFEFSANYSNEATLKNFLKVEDMVDDKLKGNSVLHLILNAHGRVDSSGFYMHSEFDNRFLRADFLNDMLEDNRGLSHLYVGSCYSGQLVDEIDEGIGLLVTGASEKGSCWLDRENSFGRIYFSQLPQDLNPKTYKNSFHKAREKFIEWGKVRNDFIHNEYKTNRKDELKTIVWDPLFKELR